LSRALTFLDPPACKHENCFGQTLSGVNCNAKTENHAGEILELLRDKQELFETDVTSRDRRAIVLNMRREGGVRFVCLLAADALAFAAQERI